MDGEKKRSRSKSADSKGSKKANSKKGDSNNGKNGKNGKKPKVESERVLDKATEKYIRGDTLKYVVDKTIKFKNLKKTMKETHDKIVESASRTASTEVLLTQKAGFIETETELEKSYKLKQADILELVDMNTRKNFFDLKLTSFGPYCINFSRNGRSMLFGGMKGHVAIMDVQKVKVKKELQLEETVHDVQYLHNESMFACAQNKYTYIYDKDGMEIHCMKNFERPYKLDFLPYHWLLTSCGHSGWIKWQDISIGEYIAGFQTGFGPVRVLKHNPFNAVSHVGHANGVVSLWSPASGKALVSMFCHKSPVSDIAIDKTGNYMVSSGMDSLVKIWDLRMFKELNKYKVDKAVMSMDISHTGLLALGVGREVQVLKDAFLKNNKDSLTYLKHELSPVGSAHQRDRSLTARSKNLLSSMRIKSVQFRPFEDVLGIGHTHGITSIICPGAGEANYDSYEANPYQNLKEMREAEVQGLLNKLGHEMISLDAQFVAGIDKDQKAVQAEHAELFKKANDNDKKPREKNKKRGRNKISAKLRRKQKNVVDAQSVKLKEKLQQQKQEREDQSNGKEGEKKAAKKGVISALDRFSKSVKK